MTRLTSIEKAGYYPFPDEHLPALASLFTPSVRGGKLLDPCAGEGRVLKHLSEAWQLMPYANELDQERAAECVRLFGTTQAVQGDLYQLRASTGGFVALWCNPPYTWDLTGSDKRRELGMLKHAWKWAQSDAFVFWCVYAHHVTAEAAGFLTARCSLLDLWKLPGLHLGEYVQVVLVARLGQPSEDPIKRTLELVEQARSGDMPELMVQTAPHYEFPTPQPRKTFLFAPKVITPDVALQAVRDGGAHFSGTFAALLELPAAAEDVRPVVRPRGRQLALILAAGMFNGLVLETDNGRSAVRSTIEPVEELVETEGDPDADDEDTARQIFQTTPQVTITLLSESGDVADISGDEALVAFIKNYKPALMRYLDERFKPLYTFDYSPLKPTLNYAKGGRLYPTQKHVIAACHTALLQRRGVIMCAEPGSGKSIMSATVAAALQSQMKPGQIVLVMCPPHLVEKWEREVKQAAPDVYTRILKNVDDVHAFMDKAALNPAHILNIAILSRETAKLGEGWESAVNWRKQRLARWAAGAERPEGISGERVIALNRPICPTCGTLIEKEKDIPADVKWLERVPRFCPQCGHALWTYSRTFSKGKRVNGQPKNPRTPLAEYLAVHYADRLYLYIIDEAHECKSSSTDQGQAMSVLANAATKTLGLTGTLYGGCASSLYGIEYIFNPRVRQRYPWGKINEWVRDMGCLERTIEYKPQYDKAGVYSGKRRIEQKPKEAPGCSPLLVSEVIDHCIFVGLADMGRQMPDFEETPVPIEPDADLSQLYFEARKSLGEYLFQCRMDGDASALGMYLQALLSWPSAPYRVEHCIHRKRITKDSDEFLEIEVHTIPALDERRIYPKERWLIDTVRAELAEGRGVAVFCRQTGTRDIQPRIEKLLTEHIPQCRPFILKSSVQADRREEVLNRQLEAGVNTLICNPKLVQTGLDLVALPTIIFFEVDYSLYVMGQASRRAWRLIQDKPCKVFYPHYTGLMEEQAIELVGLKQQAAGLLYGEETGGLSALKGAGGGNLLAQLAAEIGADRTIDDLSTLFAKHAQQTDPAESAWFTAEAIETPVPTSVLSEMTPQHDLLLAEVGEIPMLRSILADCPKPDAAETSISALIPVAKTPSRRSARRRIKWSDAPEDSPAPFSERVTNQLLPVPTNTQQLALF